MAHCSSISFFRILLSEMDWILSGYHYSMLGLFMYRFLSQFSPKASEMMEDSFLRGQIFPDSFRPTASSLLFHLIPPLCIIPMVADSVEFFFIYS